MDRNEFESDIKIDPSQLDVEAVNQADLFFKWAERSVEAKEHLDRMKFKLEVYEAKLVIEVRDDPGKYRIEKATIDSVAAAVKKSPKYVEARNYVIEAAKVHALLSNAVMAMEQRKRMLEVLITLHGQSYFAGPSTPRNLVQACMDAKKETTSQVNKKQGDRTRKRRKRRGTT